MKWIACEWDRSSVFCIVKAGRIQDLLDLVALLVNVFVNGEGEVGVVC